MNHSRPHFYRWFDNGPGCALLLLFLLMKGGFAHAATGSQAATSTAPSSKPSSAVGKPVPAAGLQSPVGSQRAHTKPGLPSGPKRVTVLRRKPSSVVPLATEAGSAASSEPRGVAKESGARGPRSGALLRAHIETSLAVAQEAYSSGHYADAAALLVRLLTQGPLPPGSVVTVYERLAAAYVALGQMELADRCFLEVLQRRPDFSLDPVVTSPKIRAALQRARASHRL